MISVPEFLTTAPRHLFFTGKGGVGKTSLACASAVNLAERGKRVLLVSTDPDFHLVKKSRHGVRACLRDCSADSPPFSCPARTHRQRVATKPRQDFQARQSLLAALVRAGRPRRAEVPGILAALWSETVDRFRDAATAADETRHRAGPQAREDCMGSSDRRSQFRGNGVLSSGPLKSLLASSHIALAGTSRKPARG